MDIDFPKPKISLRQAARKEGERIGSLIAKYQKEIVATYYCCKTSKSGNKSILEIQVTQWDVIIGLCGKDAPSCDTLKATHMLTSTRKLSSEQRKKLECECKNN